MDKYIYVIACLIDDKTYYTRFETNKLRATMRRNDLNRMAKYKSNGEHYEIFRYILADGTPAKDFIPSGDYTIIK